jgi:hypothetical protein
MNPSEIATAANDIAARMQALGVKRDWLAAAGAETPESVLNRLLAHINATDEQLRRELARLQDLITRAQAFVQANAELVAATDLVQELEARRRASSDALALAEAAVAEGEAALAPAERRAAHAQAQFALLVRTVSARDQLSAAEVAVAAVETALEASANATEAASARQSQLEQAITDAGARLELRGRLTHELAQAERRADFSRQWRAADAEVARLEAIVQGIDADALRARRATFIEQQTSQQAEISGLNDQLQALDDRQAALAQAVAVIAARLTEEDLHCPVCATDFAPGELLGLASARRADRDPTVQDLANRLAEKRLEEAATTHALRALDEGLIQHAETLTQLTEARSRAASLLQQLALAGSPDGAQTDDVLASQTADLETRLQRLTEEIAKSPSLDELRATAAQVAADLEAEAARRANLGLRRVEGINLAESAKSVLRLTLAFWSEAEGFRVDLASAQAAAEQELASASHALEKARREAEGCRLAAESARRKLADDAAALGEATGRLNLVVEQRNALVNAWRDSGMSGEPDPTRLTSLVDETARRLQLNVAMAERQRQMTAAYRRWTQDDALRAAECRIQEQAAGERPQARTAQLRAAVDSAMADLDGARAARSRMETLVTQMQSTANEYAKRVLKPLNDTIQRFSRPLITWSDAVIVYKAEHLATRAELRPKAVRTEPDGQVTDLDINPNYYFSEGQLSALSVSALLAASTKFHWSRWRALLMDDPLQHNDVIHASAFMDLMRQLVRVLRYQVIMSTHDATEAEFLVRKCRSAGIPHRVHELAPPGDDGLVSQAA